MTATLPKVTLHMVSSLDFFIAKADNTVAWLESPNHYERGATFEGAEEVVKTIGCYLIGSRTYEHALTLGWPYGNVPTIVLTHRKLHCEKETVEFYSGDVPALVNDRLKPSFGSVWVVGGAEVAKIFLREKLADELRIMIAPILLGGGTPFVDGLGGEQALRLTEVTPYQNGMVELRYDIVK